MIPLPWEVVMVLRAVQDYGAKSVREIGPYLGLTSSSSIHRWVKEAERLGFIKQEAGKNGTLRPGVRVVNVGIGDSK